MIFSKNSQALPRGDAIYQIQDATSDTHSNPYTSDQIPTEFCYLNVQASVCSYHIRQSTTRIYVT